MAEPFVREGPRIFEQSRRRQDAEAKGAAALDAYAPKATAPPIVSAVSNDPRMQETVARLAQLRSLDYALVRKRKSKELSVPVADLDAAVRAARPKEEDLKDSPVRFVEHDLWLEPVDGGEVLDNVADALKRYVLLPRHADVAVALWIAHTHCFDAFEHTPRLNITAPEKQCGKSLLLDLLEQMTPRAVHADSVSTAVLFRLTDQYCPTLLIDEYDSFLRDNEDLRGALNAGHKRGGQHLRCDGDNNEVRAFRTFGPVALAGIGKLPGTLADRAVVIKMKRATRGELAERFDSRRARHLHDLGSKLARWAADHRPALETADPCMPEGIFNRPADNWRPLLAIADVAGPRWAKLAREAARALTGGDKGSGIGEELLADIRGVFTHRGVDRISSGDLIEALCADPERPWATFHQGKPMTQRQLASRLSDFEIVSVTVRIGDRTPKGYSLEQFEEAFKRYPPVSIAGSGDSQAQHRHIPTATGDCGLLISATQDGVLRIEKSPKPAPDKACGGVADGNSPSDASKAMEAEEDLHL